MEKCPLSRVRGGSWFLQIQKLLGKRFASIRPLGNHSTEQQVSQQPIISRVLLLHSLVSWPYKLITDVQWDFNVFSSPLLPIPLIRPWWAWFNASHSGGAVDYNHLYSEMALSLAQWAYLLPIAQSTGEMMGRPPQTAMCHQVPFDCRGAPMGEMAWSVLWVGWGHRQSCNGTLMDSKLCLEKAVLIGCVTLMDISWAPVTWKTKLGWLVQIQGHSREDAKGMLGGYVKDVGTWNVTQICPWWAPSSWYSGHWMLYL